jgi:hypothetical protein
MIQRIEAAGGTLISVQDGFDLATSTGRLIFQILLSIGEWELNRIRASWNEARGRAISRGAHLGSDPFGYRSGEDGRLCVDTEEAALIRTIFNQRAAGLPCKAIARALTDSGALTRLGVPFSDSAILKMIRNPAYKGEVRHGNFRNPDAHEPIVEKALWQRCQYTPKHSPKKIRSALYSLVRCGTCGRMMSFSLTEGAKSRLHVYRCNDRPSCARPAYARGDELDPLVEEFIFASRRMPSIDTRDEVLACESAVAKAEANLAAFRDEPSILTALGADAFAAGLADRRLHLEKKLVDLARARSSETFPLDTKELQKEWVDLNWEGRQAAFAKLLDCVIVEPGSEPLERRAWVFRRGKGPIGFSQGKLTLSSRSFGEDGERLPKPRRWSPGRLEKEVREFLVGHSRWPTYRDFAQAGRARLFAQVLRFGGPYYWGPLVGVDVPRQYVRWSDDVLRDALAPMLAGRNTWPGAAAFEKAGMKAVYIAAREHGGLRRWAQEFAIDYGNVRRTDWTEERIAQELKRFVGDRRDFPRKAEFKAARLRPLYDAILRKGGADYWISRMGLEPPPRIAKQ